MAEKIISPGVFTKEIDESFLPSAVGDIGAVVVGPTVKGPTLVPTVVSSYSEYQAIFGDVFKSGSGYHQYLTSFAAKNYLENAGRLTVCRIMGAGFNHASATVSASIDPAIVGHADSAPHSASITLPTVIAAHGDSGNVSCSFAMFDDTDYATTVNFQMTGSSANNKAFIEANNSATTIYFQSQSGGATVDGVTYADTVAGARQATAAHLALVINNSQSLHNLPMSASHIGTTAGKIKLTLDNFGSMGHYDAAEEPTPGGGYVNGSSPKKKFVKIINNDGGTTANNFTSESFQGGRDHGETLGTGFTATTPFKIHTLANGLIMNNSSSAAGGTNGVLTDGTSNNIRYEIGSLNKKKGTFTLLVRRGDDIHKRKNILETFNNVSLDPNSNNYIAKVVGDSRHTISGTADDPFLSFSGEYPSKSKYIRVEVLKNTPDYLDENGNVRDPELSASLPTFHSGSNSGSEAGSFSGGDDGTVTHPLALYENIENTNSQGFNLGVSAVKDQYLKALNLLANADEFDFNLLLLPGIVRELSNHTSVVTKAIDVCEQRGDAFAVIDPVVKGTTNLNTVTDQSKAMDSNYAAVYWPWIQMPDTQLGVNRWVPPSVAVSGVYSFNDRVGHPWFAPAGLNRGVISTAVQAERPLTHKNRDTLYAKNVNPIATFPGQGVCVWGQKTLQKKSSALDRVNVRRLLIKVKKFIASASRFLVFEQNTATTRQRFLNIANPFLEQVQSQSGLNAFRVVMDESNNTPDTIDRNIMYGQIFVQPTKTAEFIVLDFTVQPTGASFPE